MCFVYFCTANDGQRWMMSEHFMQRRWNRIWHRHVFKSAGFQICLKLSDYNNIRIRIQTPTHPYCELCELTALFPRLPGWAGTGKVKPIWISLKQETVSGSGISWAICKSAPRCRQITTPAPHHSVFYRTNALPAAQPTASKHWRHYCELCKL